MKNTIKIDEAFFKRFCAMAATIATRPKEKRREMERFCREALRNEDHEVKSMLDFVFSTAEKYAVDK